MQFCVTLATDLVAALVTGSVHHGPRCQSLQPAARLTERHFPISLGKSPAGWLVQLGLLVSALFAAERREEKERQLPNTSVESATFPCVLCPVLNCTTQKRTHKLPRASMLAAHAVTLHSHNTLMH